MTTSCHPAPSGEHTSSPETATCTYLATHPAVVEAAQAAMPSEAEQAALAELFRMLGDPTRLRILTVLEVSELCVCDIARLLGMTVSAISHQLRLLKATGLVTARRAGKAIIYAIADDHVRVMMQNGLVHIRE